MQSEEDVNRVVEQYADTVRRLCMIHLKNDADSEDIFQTVFLKYVLHCVPFESEEHEKAWFYPRDDQRLQGSAQKFFPQPHRLHRRNHRAGCQPAAGYPGGLGCGAFFAGQVRDAVYLHYYEGYTAPQIGRILGKNVNTIYTILTRSKKMLREKLGGDADEAGTERSV